MSDISASVTRSVNIPDWHVDWACPMCARYGKIDVKVTGGERGKDGKPNPLTNDEQFYRKVELAHREATSGLCTQKVRRLLVGLIWRWKKTTTGREMIILQNNKGPTIREYAWPPRRPPWVPR